MRRLDGCNKSFQSLPLIRIRSSLNTVFAAGTKERDREIHCIFVCVCLQRGRETVCVYVCVCLWCEVCVCKRVRERERDGEKQCVYALEIGDLF
jgi:hypothetical protein